MFPVPGPFPEVLLTPAVELMLQVELLILFPVRLKAQILLPPFAKPIDNEFGAGQAGVLTVMVVLALPVVVPHEPPELVQLKVIV